MGDPAGLETGPGAAQQMVLEAPLHVGLERQELDGQRLAHRFAQGGRFGTHRAEAGALVELLAAMGEHGQEHEGRDRGSRHEAQGRGNDQKDGEEQADNQQRQVSGQELAQLVDLADALHDRRARVRFVKSIRQLQQVTDEVAADRGFQPRAGVGGDPAAQGAQGELEGDQRDHADRQHVQGL